MPLVRPVSDSGDEVLIAAVQAPLVVSWKSYPLMPRPPLLPAAKFTLSVPSPTEITPMVGAPGVDGVAKVAGADAAPSPAIDFALRSRMKLVAFASPEMVNGLVVEPVDIH